MPPERKRDPAVYLKDMSDSAPQAIEHLGDLQRDEFLKSTLVQDAVVRRLEIIGEAAKRVDKNVRSKFTDHNWSDICGMRDMLIHQYGAVDLDIVFDTVKTELPRLVAAIESYLQKHTRSTS